MANLNYIANATQLNKELNNILESVINNVSESLLSDFLAHLDAVMYSVPAGDYERNRENGGFYSGWNISSETMGNLAGYVRSLVFDGSKLVPPSDYNQGAHGGRYGSDIRDIMAGVLNDIESNDRYSYGGGANYLADGFSNTGYWTSYLWDIDKKINNWLDLEFKKYGIVRG